MRPGSWGPWWLLGLGVVVGSTGSRALRYALDAPPGWLDAGLGAVLSAQMRLLNMAMLSLVVQAPAAVAIVLLFVVRRRWVVDRCGDRWVLRAPIAAAGWTAAAIDAVALDLHPSLTGLYAGTALLVALLYATERRAGWERFGRVAWSCAGVALVAAAAAGGNGGVDALGVVTWTLLALPAGVLLVRGVRLSDALLVLTFLAAGQQMGLSLGLRPFAAAEGRPGRRVLGEGDAYSFCEQPARHRIFAVANHCFGTDLEACRDDGVDEYDARDLSLVRRHALFSDSFYGRMLHLVCLDDAVLVGMAMTRYRGELHLENVARIDMQANGEDAVTPRWLGAFAGHRLLLHPTGEAVFAVSEYSNDVVWQGTRAGEKESAGFGRSRAIGDVPSLQTEVNALHRGRGTGFFAQWVGGTRVYEVDLANGGVVASYPTENGGNHSLAVDEAAGRLIVTGLWGLEVIDLESGQVLLRRRTEFAPRLPVIDEARGLVYVTTTFGNHVWVFDRETFEVRGKLFVGIGARNAHLTADGRYLLTGGAQVQSAWDLDELAPAWRDVD